MRLALPACLALIVAAGPVLSQTAPSPAEDWAAIEARAARDARVRDNFNAMMGQIGGLAEDRREAFRYFLEDYGVDTARLGENAVHYRDMALVEPAQYRGRFIGQMLAADLDGDQTVTAKEITTFLRAADDSEIAAVFFTGDADGDGTLSLAEISTVADQEAQDRVRNSGRVRQYDLISVFDFDDNGIVDADEVARATEAYAQASGL